jgi:hypothetical protein
MVKKLFNFLAILLGFFASIATILTFITTIHDWAYPKDVEPKNIKGYYTRYEFVKVVIYSGEITNEESSHANDLTLKASLIQK